MCRCGRLVVSLYGDRKQLVTQDATNRALLSTGSNSNRNVSPQSGLPRLKDWAARCRKRSRPVGKSMDLIELPGSCGGGGN